MNTKGRKLLTEPKKVFMTQREMSALRRENQMWPGGHNNWIFPRECADGPSGSGVPSFRTCHQRGRTFIANKIGLSRYRLMATSKGKRKLFLARA